MLIGHILYNYKTSRLAAFTQLSGRTVSFDIPEQDLALIYKGSTIRFHINEMDDATCVEIISL